MSYKGYASKKSFQAKMARLKRDLAPAGIAKIHEQLQRERLGITKQQQRSGVFVKAHVRNGKPVKGYTR